MASVLYVDDEDSIRRAMKAWLVRRGHTVFTAGSIEDACSVLASNQVDGAFIDLWLGTESGFDLFEWLDMNHPGVAANVVFVTGALLLDPDAARALAAFDRPILTKPFELGELERIILEWSPEVDGT